MEAPTFDAPGKGPWELESTHFSRPFTRFIGPAFVEAFPRGFAEGMARYGSLLDHMEPALVNGFFYQQPVAYLAPKGAMKPPPAPVLWLLTRLHPKMRARIATSERAFREKQWRKDLERWDSHDKPAAVQQHEAIQLVDVRALPDEGLATHVEDCYRHAGEMIRLHQHYTATSVVVTGLLLSEAMAWTGATAGEVCGVLRGSSPISNGFAAEELVKAGDALANNDAARSVLRSAAPSTEKIDVLSGDPDVGPAVRGYVSAVRFRSVGYDVGDPTAGEMPDLLVEALLSAAEGTAVPRTDESRLEALRARVPAEHVADFDEYVAEARLVNRLRDERGVYADGWATGLARRALLEAGARLHERGLLLEAEHAVDLSLDEVTAMLRGQEGPSAATAAQHHEWRTTHTTADAPPFLNAMPAAPPPVDILPRSARPAARAVEAVLTNLFVVPTTANTETVLHGLSVNTGIYEGTARLVDDSADFGRIRQGDVLVARNTSPYFNVVLPLLGAIVTDRGGQLSHAAIVAREYGIPGVVGTRDATEVIPDGARVRVDGTTGEVRVLAAAAQAR
ncbi:MAG TPA: PEP-utilizing enzyme [Marmoricola sp.]|jgi:pyruvate,water dikinase|nr:PEP-utilizing enzyme [Marmoricola sp.]